MGVIEKKSIKHFVHCMDSKRLVGHYLKTPDKLRNIASKVNDCLKSAAKHSLSSTEKQWMFLIATMEYEIEDWDIEIKIGGLGAMAEY